MPYYSLLVPRKQKKLKTVAQDRNEALVVFGKELGVKLRDKDEIANADVYLLDEWEDDPHFVNHHIPVFASAR